jgi:predicted negative regulator of RcsB-dependent stress response
VGQTAQNAGLSFPTQEAKAAEAKKLLASTAAKYAGSDEGQVAHYYLGALAVDQGNLAEAEKHFKQASDSGDEKYASLAKLALGDLYYAQGRADQGEKVLRSLMQNPTMFVSKEQATLALAKHLMKTKPEEARKLVEPLRTQRGEVSKVAIQLYSEMPAR